MHWASLRSLTSPVRAIALIILAGAAVRLALLLVVDPSVDTFSGDTMDYVNGAPDRPPLYPLFLDLTLPLGWWFPLAVQSALSIGSGIAAFFAFKARRGLTCGLLIAACPFLAIYDFRLLSESLYINLLWLGWLVLARQGLASGLLVGGAILTRFTLVLLPALALAMLRSRKALVMALAAYLVALPFSTGQGHFGLNLWIGTWERNGNWYLNGLDKPDFPGYAFQSPEQERFVRDHWLKDDSALRDVAIQRIATDPLGTARAWIERYPRLWVGTRADQIAFRLERHSLPWTIAKAGFFGLNLLLLGFGIWGALKPDKLFVPPVLYAALVYIPFHNVETRYSLFALPFLIYLGVNRLAGLIASRRDRLDQREAERQRFG